MAKIRRAPDVCNCSAIARNCALFLSDETSYITGETIYVDGGRLGLNYTC